MRLSKNFTLDEFLFSQTAIYHDIDMTPPRHVVRNIEKLVKEILQPIRGGIGAPVVISSGYRPKELNSAIRRSATNSPHINGCAADIKVIGKSPYEVACFIEEHFLIKCDQLINEYGRWVHVSIADKPRNQVMTAQKVGKKTKYVFGLEEI